MAKSNVLESYILLTSVVYEILNMQQNDVRQVHKTI